MFSEASDLGLIHCVVAYKGVLTLIYRYRLVRVSKSQYKRTEIFTKTLKGGKVLFVKIMFKI